MGIFRSTPLSITLFQEVSDLLQKDAIKPVPQSHSLQLLLSLLHSTKQWWWPLLHPESQKPQFLHLSPPHFEWPHLKLSYHSFIGGGGWFTVMDLKDTYFYINIYLDHRRFLSFALNPHAFQFKILPFWILHCPPHFHKMHGPSYILPPYLRNHCLAIHRQLAPCHHLNGKQDRTLSLWSGPCSTLVFTSIFKNPHSAPADPFNIMGPSLTSTQVGHIFL